MGLTQDTSRMTFVGKTSFRVSTEEIDNKNYKKYLHFVLFVKQEWRPLSNLSRVFNHVKIISVCSFKKALRHVVI